MEKLAENQYPVHELIRMRWSPRAFAARSVEPEKLRSLLEAARWAASCFNAQPWSFIVATKDQAEEHERLLGCLVESNARWAQHAPVLMLSVAQLNFEFNGKPNRHALHDVGLAVATLTLQATAQGLALHQMAGFDLAKARAQFKIPNGYEPVAAIALGYPNEPESMPEDLRENELAPRTRRPLESFVFAGSFGQSSPLFKK
jgi:nitroreductase